jgi:hypothetical protein
MQGRAFLGPHRVAPQAEETVFLFADRFDEIYGMRRGITDGRFKYIRRFTPHLPAAPYSYYQFSMPSWVAIRKAWQEGRLTGVHRTLWEKPQAVEELFDTQGDPWEVHNLAQQPQHAERLAAMRDQLRCKMSEVSDTGLVPEPMFADVAPQLSIWEYVHSEAFPLPRILQLAWMASARDPQNLPRLRLAIASEHPVARYWGALGCLILGSRATAARSDLERLLDDPLSANRVTAAHALFEMGVVDRAKAAVVAELDRDINDYASQLAVDTLSHMNALEKIPQPWIERILADDQAHEYLRRLARRVDQSRQPAAQETARPEL